MLRYDLLTVYVIGFLILTTVPSEGFLVYPKNTAVVAGSRTTLNCSTTYAPPTWGWASPKHAAIAFSRAPGAPCTVGFPWETNTPNQQLFAVNASSTSNVRPNYCNLIILNATSAMADTYSCSGDDTPSVSAVLLVLDSGPQCSTDAVNNTVVHPGQVTMNCSVQYDSSSGWIPSLLWNTTDPTFDGTSGTTAYSTLTYNTSASTPISSYSCSVVYNSSVFVDIQPCSTNPVNVLWCPMAVKISGAWGGYITPGSNLTCSASGNPSPTYQWFNSTGNLLANGPSLTVWNQDTYTCNASNIANGHICSMPVSQIVNVTQTTTRKPAATTVSSNPVVIPDTFPTKDTPSTMDTTSITPNVSCIPCVNTDIQSTSSNGAVAAAIVLGILFALALICIVILIIYIVILKRNHAAGGKPRIYEAPQDTNTRQEASSTMYTSLELPPLQEGSEIRGRGKQSIYEVPLNKNVEPEASSTMYTPLELPGKQGEASKEGLYENAMKTR